MKSIGCSHITSTVAASVRAKYRVTVVFATKTEGSAIDTKFGTGVRCTIVLKVASASGAGSSVCGSAV